MALIQYTINYDATSGKSAVTMNVLTIDPHDEITFITDSPGTAILCKGGSPFVKPAAGDTYKVPMRGSATEPLQVTKPSPSAKPCQWECGQVDASGNFTAWPGAGPVFPNTRSE